MPPTPHPPPHHHPHSHSHSLHRPIDPKIWRTYAGNSIQIPILHSRVYYFPQGHLKQYSSSTPLLISPLVLSKPLFLCHISAVHFLSYPTIDEVFAKLLLLPIPNHEHPNHHEPPNDDVFDDANETDKVISFAKILTPSDTNNGGGFSIPGSVPTPSSPRLTTRLSRRSRRSPSLTSTALFGIFAIFTGDTKGEHM